jgi:hypothetical protein
MAVSELPAEPRELDAEEFRSLAEDRIRRRFNMSIEEFVEEFRAGRLDDYPAAFDLIVLLGADSG